MKKLAAILCLSALTSGAFAQGFVVFNNNSTTLISASTGASGASVPISGARGSYYFALLISPTAAGPFTFSGAYATNIGFAGRINGGSNLGIPVTGWRWFMFFEVAGWSANLGSTWNSAWVNSDGSAKPVNDPVWSAGGFFGTSAITAGAAGSPDGPGLPQAIFGPTGVAGFNLAQVGTVVPEPGTMALAGLGAAALLIFRRRKYSVRPVLRQRVLGMTGMPQVKILARGVRPCCFTGAFLMLWLALLGEVAAQDYTYITNNGTITITGYYGAGGAVVVPSSINQLPVAALEDGAFMYGSKVTSIALPSTLSDIGAGAFAGCPNLTAITVDALSSAYTSVDGVLFSKDQTALVAFPAGRGGTYSIPSGVISLGDWAFYSCASLLT